MHRVSQCSVAKVNIIHSELIYLQRVGVKKNNWKWNFFLVLSVHWFRLTSCDASGECEGRQNRKFQQKTRHPLGNWNFLNEVRDKCLFRFVLCYFLNQFVIVVLVQQSVQGFGWPNAGKRRYNKRRNMKRLAGVCAIRYDVRYTMRSSEFVAQTNFAVSCSTRNEYFKAFNRIQYTIPLFVVVYF